MFVSNSLGLPVPLSKEKEQLEWQEKNKIAVCFF